MKPRSTLVAMVLVLAQILGSLVANAAGEGEDVPFSTREWRTDFSKHSVPLDEILSGGPPKDGIPAIDNPVFVSPEDADRWIGDREPIVVFSHDGVVRGYPWQILMWHEIVNDEIQGLPIAITYCPLCNTAIAFDRRLDGHVLDFGTTGKLRHSDLVMYDRQTESWWQQATGEAIVGKLTGKRLRFLPAPTISWADFKKQYPESAVLSRNTGHRRKYGSNPYTGYDMGKPFMFRGETDGRLPAMERVVIVPRGEHAVAYPLRTLASERVVNHEVDGVPTVLFHKKGTASAVDNPRIDRGRDVGAVAVYSRRLGEQTLTFQRDSEELYRDEETESLWNFFGEAIEGSLAGSQLEPLVHYVPFWFAWAAFSPDTPVYGL